MFNLPKKNPSLSIRSDNYKCCLRPTQIRGPTKLHHQYVYCEPICPNLFQEHSRITVTVDSSYSIKELLISTKRNCCHNSTVSKIFRSTKESIMLYPKKITTELDSRMKLNIVQPLLHALPCRIVAKTALERKVLFLLKLTNNTQTSGKENRFHETESKRTINNQLILKIL